MMTQTPSTFAVQERPVPRTQERGRGNDGTLIPCVICSSEDDGEAAAISVAEAIIHLNQRIDHLLIVTDGCNVTIPSLREQRGNVSPIVLDEAGGAK